MVGFALARGESNRHAGLPDGDLSVAVGLAPGRLAVRGGEDKGFEVVGERVYVLAGKEAGNTVVFGTAPEADLGSTLNNSIVANHCYTVTGVVSGGIEVNNPHASSEGNEVFSVSDLEAYGGNLYVLPNS